MAENTMQGKIVLVTGATNGIGRVAALELAKMGAQVAIVGRSKPRTEETAKLIQQESGSSVTPIIADLSLMTGVRSAVADFKNHFDRLHVLVNNAGAIFGDRQETVEGYEMTFALNHLNYFLLTNLLLDTLKASAPARIVNVSSDTHTGAKVNFDDLQTKRGYGMGGMKAYGQSKLMNILFTYELARRLEGSHVTANVLHPGRVATGFGHNNGGVMNLVMDVLHRFSLTPEQGADTIIYLASSPEVEGVSGKYFVKRKAIKSNDASYDEAAARRLWEASEEITGVGAAV
jgi:retinol dehydrogenase 12